MNKLLIVFLAVCLIGVHAFVKRDAPAPTTEKNYIEDFKNTITKLADDITAQAQSAANPEAIKQNVNKFIDEAQKVLQQFVPKKE